MEIHTLYYPKIMMIKRRRYNNVFLNNKIFFKHQKAKKTAVIIYNYFSFLFYKKLAVSIKTILLILKFDLSVINFVLLKLSDTINYFLIIKCKFYTFFKTTIRLQPFFDFFLIYFRNRSFNFFQTFLLFF